MPTPVQHLAVARDVLVSDLSTNVRRKLKTHWGAHLLGHIAPDAQNKSGQSREETHFFTLPPSNQTPAHEQMFTAHPILSKASGLAPAQAVFVAGYIAHLLLDELWIQHIFAPIFGLDANWGTLRERVLIHNVLRTWLDQRDLSRLRGDESELLRQAKPEHWLPFITDSALDEWRDEIAEQLQPGAAMRTVQVFAARSSISPGEFDQLLTEPGSLEKHVFTHLPQHRIVDFTEMAVASSCNLTVAYMEDKLCML